jgi:hypothetical protein
MYDEGVFINVNSEAISYENKGSGLFTKTHNIEIEITVHHTERHADILENVVDIVVNHLATDPEILKCVDDQPDIDVRGFDYDDIGETNRATCDVNVSYATLEELHPVTPNELNLIHFEIRPVEVEDANQPVYEQDYETI